MWGHGCEPSPRWISQPAASKHVASLETELGIQLVVRGRPAATLTPAGEVLADYVLRAEALLANARRALAAGADGQIGTLALAASGIPGTYLLPALLARFHAQHPGIEIDFPAATSGGALEVVRAHRVEIAVVGGMTVPGELEPEPPWRRRAGRPASTPSVRSSCPPGKR